VVLYAFHALRFCLIGFRVDKLSHAKSTKNSQTSYISMKFGTEMDPIKKLSQKFLAHSMDVPIRYDHLKFIL